MANVFSETKTLQSFGTSRQLTGVKLIQNPKEGGKLFGEFSNGETARLAKDVTDLKGDLSVSWFTPESGDASWMIHRTGASANVVAEMSFGAPSAVATPVASADLKVG